MSYLKGPILIFPNSALSSEFLNAPRMGETSATFSRRWRMLRLVVEPVPVLVMV